MRHPHSANHLKVQTLRPALAAAAILFTASWSFGAKAQQDCRPIRFPPGHSAAVVTGTVPASGRNSAAEILCYSLAVGDGQNATIRLESGHNVAISIPDIGDARDGFEFVTRRGTYELHVFQLFPGGTTEPFRISVKVAD